MLRRFLPSGRGLPRAYWYVWSGMLVNKLGTFVVPFLALYLTQERGFSVERAGWVVSLYGLGSIAAAPLGGILADRVGRRATMMLGLLLGAAAMTHLALARATEHIALATLLLGVVADSYRPATSAFISDVVRPEDRGRAYGLMYWAVNVGFSIGPVVAGVLASASYFALFAVDAATSLAFAVIVWTAVRETRPALPEHVKRPHPLAPFADSAFMAFVGVTFLTGIIFFQHLVALPLDMRAHGLSARDFGLLIAINGVMIVLFQPFAASVLERYRRSRVLAVSAVLIGLGFGATAWAHDAATYAGSIAVWTVGEIVMAGLGPAVVADLAPLPLRGTYQGVYQMAWGAAFFVGPALGSTALQARGPLALWGGCAALGLVCALANLAIAGMRGRRIASLRTASASALPAAVSE
jgi:MFS family permease